jgi:hypothetical protein
METVAHWGGLGWIVFTIVVGSLFIVVVASLIGRKKYPQVTGVFLGAIGVMAVVFLGIFWIGPQILGLFIP